ncbi:MAG: hypothetical protein J6C59_06790 [Muribaculaceae bacterium]|nr:hypothetical protein [Muribaculaceae bacterium]
MKKTLLCLALATTALTASAREPQRGYRGFVDFSNSITHFGSDYEKTTYWNAGFSTTHGYQFNHNLFVGAGLAMEFNDFDILPLFAAVRYDRTFGRFTPYAELRAGYNCANGGGIYFSPTVGYRFNWGRKANINVGLGLSVWGYSYDRYYVDMDYENSAFIIEYMGRGNSVKPSFSFRIGVDF